MPNQRRHPRTPLKCRIKVSHESFGVLIAQTRDLSDGGVYIRHPQLAELAPGTLISGQVQDLPIEAPLLEMEVMRVDGEGVGVRFILDHGQA
jgi:hypothetical protein